MGEELIIFGGVRLKRNDVEYKGIETDIDGNKHYVVIFKNGISVAYQGTHGEDAYISTYNIERGKCLPEENLFYAKGIEGLEVQGALDKQDQIKVRESSIIGIDVYDGGRNFEDSVTIENSKSTFGARAMSREDYHYGDGMIEADSCDSISIDDASKGLRNKINIKS